MLSSLLYKLRNCHLYQAADEPRLFNLQFSNPDAIDRGCQAPRTGFSIFSQPNINSQTR